MRSPTSLVTGAALLIAGALLSGCGQTSHAAARPAPSAATRATQRVVIRPVTSDGQPVAGYTVEQHLDDVLDCGAATAPAQSSPVAVDPGIVQCFPAYLAAIACWPSGPARVLCYLDPWSKKLIAMRASGTVRSVSRPAKAVPLALELADGTRCRLRDGGTMPTLPGHPDLVDYYDCADGQLVWSETNSSPMDVTAAAWTVRLAKVTGGLHIGTVRTAYYVGTAAP